MSNLNQQHQAARAASGSSPPHLDVLIAMLEAAELRFEVLDITAESVGVQVKDGYGQTCCTLLFERATGKCWGVE